MRGPAGTLLGRTINARTRAALRMIEAGDELNFFLKRHPRLLLSIENEAGRVVAEQVVTERHSILHGTVATSLWKAFWKAQRRYARLFCLEQRMRARLSGQPHAFFPFPARA